MGSKKKSDKIKKVEKDNIVARRAVWDCDAYVQGVRRGDRTALGRAITLIESRNLRDRALANDVLNALLPYTGKAQRIGISGVPGVGKSTLIDTLGSYLTQQVGKRVAVLAIDPSSTITGGSILGDKTRMSVLAADPNAFIRPSPAGGMLGGVANATREAMLVCEAAGYDVILIETVGIGQSEMGVADMVDVLVMLMLPGAGDGLQGIKRGILEVADVVCINKADGDNQPKARVAKSALLGALKLLRSVDVPPVVLCSGLRNEGLDAMWQQIDQLWQARHAGGALETRRAQQHVAWMWSLIESRLSAAFRAHAGVRALLPALEQHVRANAVHAGVAADQLITSFLQKHS